MKKTIFLITIFLALIVLVRGVDQNATISAPDGWTQLVSTEGRFRAMMPGEPTQETSTEKYSSGSFKVHTFVLTTKENQFGVYYLDFDNPVTYPDQAQGMLNEACKKLERGIGKIKEKIEMNYGDYPAIECRLEFKGGVQSLRATVMKERLYWIMTTTFGGKNLSEDSNRFLSSFNIVVPPRPGVNVETPDDDNIASTSPSLKKMVLLNNPRPDYTEEARHRRVTGIVVVVAVFRADGLITDLSVRRGLGYGLDENAIKAVRKIRFIPAERNGKKIDFKGTMRVTFTL